MSNINGLGLGLTGKTFSMVPNKLRVKSTYVKSNKIFNRKLNIHLEENTQPNKQKVNPPLLVNKPMRQVNKQESEKNISEKHQSLTEQTPQTEQNIPIPENPSKENPSKENPNVSDNNQKPTDNNQNPIDNNQKPPNLEKGLNETNSFQQQCINNLYSNFSFLKLRLSKYQYFNDSFICYIDFTSMKKLIDWSRQNNISENMMTLKTLSNYKGIELFELGAQQEILNLVNTLENLGPTQHAIIVLKKPHLEQLSKLGCHQSFWPSGNNGITWISSS